MIGRALYRYGWDTRSRNLDALRMVRRVLNGDGLLDAGCGAGGLATFLPGVQVTGIDIH
jgi:2-polyprenyl-3-methyl-5-hydroxy-6-metoxy-1,4-benzoquinol methylase